MKFGALEVDRSVHADGETQVETPVRLSDTRLIGACEIGAFTYFNHSVEVTNASIGRYCSVGQRVLIGPGHHRTDYLTTHPIGSDPSGYSAGMHAFRAFHATKMTAARRAEPPLAPTRLGHDVWVGAHAVIMQGVQVGTGAVVGAGAVVTSDVAPFTIVAGVPARVLRPRFDAERVAAILASRWWEHDLSALPERDFSDPELFLAALAAARPPPLRPHVARVR